MLRPFNSNSYMNIFVNGNFNFNSSVQLKTPTKWFVKEIDTYSMTDLKTYMTRIYMSRRDYNSGQWRTRLGGDLFF